MTTPIVYVTALDLEPGQMIDLEPVLGMLIPDWDPDRVDPARFEYATVESVTYADPVNGVEACLIVTDLHTVKVPAALGIPINDED